MVERKKRGLGRGLGALIPDANSNDRPVDVFFSGGSTEDGKRDGETKTSRTARTDPAASMQSSRRRKPKATGTTRSTSTATETGTDTKASASKTSSSKSTAAKSGTAKAGSSATTQSKSIGTKAAPSKSTGTKSATTKSSSAKTTASKPAGTKSNASKTPSSKSSTSKTTNAKTSTAKTPETRPPSLRLNHPRLSRVPRRLTGATLPSRPLPPNPPHRRRRLGHLPHRLLRARRRPLQRRKPVHGAHPPLFQLLTRQSTPVKLNRSSRMRLSRRRLRLRMMFVKLIQVCIRLPVVTRTTLSRMKSRPPRTLTTKIEILRP